MTAYITVTLNSTAHVREILENQSSVDLYNVCTLLAKDDGGAIHNIAGENSIYGTADVKKAVIANDSELYGMIVQHGTDLIRLQSYGGTTYIDKYYTDYKDDGTEQSLTANINMYEYGRYNPENINSDEYKALNYVKEQTEGTFYDLLPKGTSVDNISVKTYSASSGGKVCSIDYRTVADWQGSGRIMLIIDVKAPEGEPNYYEINNAPSYNYATVYSGFILTYRLVNSYFNIVDNGTGTVNLAAYRSKTDILNSGASAPDQNGFNYFQRLESEERDDGEKNTVYSLCYYAFTYPTAAIYGIFKQVKAAGDFGFGAETEVFSAGKYTYQLRYNNSSVAGKAVNLIIYDVLEELGSWHGTLESIDTSFAEAKGIAPVIYYSTAVGLSPHTKDEHADLSDSALWSTQRPPAGITAIAIDLSHKEDGSLYQISPSETIHCLVNMTAPAGGEVTPGDPAINKVSYRLDYILGGVTTESKGLSKETKVSIREPEILIIKNSDPESGPDKDDPAPIGNGETIEYTVSIKNSESVSITDIEVMDTIPDALVIDAGSLKYFFGTGPNNIYPVTDSGRVSVKTDGRKLVFTIIELPAYDMVSFIIPAMVKTDCVPNTDIVNTAYITKINDKDFVIKSNDTWHKTPDSTPIEPEVDHPVVPPVKPPVVPPEGPKIEPPKPQTPWVYIYTQPANNIYKSRLPRTGDDGIPPFITILIILSFIGVVLFSWDLVKQRKE